MADVTAELGMQAFGLKSDLGLTHSSRGYLRQRVSRIRLRKGGVIK